MMLQLPGSRMAPEGRLRGMQLQGLGQHLPAADPVCSMSEPMIPVKVESDIVVDVETSPFEVDRHTLPFEQISVTRRGRE